MCMTRSPVCTESDHDTGMLDGPVGIQKLGSHCTHIFSLCIHEHRFHPVGSDDLYVVVKQKQILAVRIIRTVVIYP